MAARTLLVADDSQIVHRIVEMACSDEDVDVCSVTDGSRAMAEIVERRPDLVLADIGMPAPNGYDIAAFVRGRADLTQIPIVLMTGMFEEADHARARELGCVEVVVKPLKPQYVASRLREWFESQPAAATSPVSSEPPSIDDYFSRLDAAFKSLERPGGVSLPGPASVIADDQAAAHAVPTLQELLQRLPEETRTRLTSLPAVPSSQQDAETAVLDALAVRLLEHLAKRDDLLDEIVRRVVQRGGAGHHG